MDTRVLAAVGLTALVALGAARSQAGPTGDYGEIPVGNLGEGIEAYNGVLSRFQTYYSHKTTVTTANHARGMHVDDGSLFWLGLTPPTLTTDTTQDPANPDNDSYPFFVVDSLGPNPLASVTIPVSTSAAFVEGTPVYLNIFTDQNRDGQMAEGKFIATQIFAWNTERIIADLELSLESGTLNMINVSGFRLESPELDHWTKVIVTSRPLGEVLGVDPVSHDTTQPDAPPFTYGEIEDFRRREMGFCDPQNPPPATSCTVLEPADPIQLGAHPGADQKVFCYARWTGPFRKAAPLIPPAPGDPPMAPMPFGDLKVVAVNGGCNLDTTWANVGYYGTHRVWGVVGAPTIGQNGNPGINAAVEAANDLPATACRPKQGPAVVPVGLTMAQIIGKAKPFTVFFPNPPIQPRGYGGCAVVKWLGSAGSSHVVKGLIDSVEGSAILTEPLDATGTEEIIVFTGAELESNPHKLVLNFDLELPPLSSPNLTVMDPAFAVGRLSEPGILLTTTASGTAASLSANGTLASGTLGSIASLGTLTNNLLPVSGRLRLCLIAPVCGQPVTIPLTRNATAGVGIGGLVTGTGSGVRISIQAAPWTLMGTVTGVATSNGGTGTLSVSGFTHGATSFTLTGMSGTGAVRLVAPFRITTSQSGPDLGGFAILNVRFVPEPGRLLMLLSASAALLLLGYRRSRR